MKTADIKIQNKPYSRQATKHFLVCVRMVVMKRPVIKGTMVDSVKDLCDVIGMQATNLSLMEAGKRNVILEQLISFCRIFGFNLDDVVFGRVK